MFQHISYLLLDAARMGSHMEEAKTRNKAHDSLYSGDKKEHLQGVAPYIFQFAHPSPFSHWYLKTGWGDSWGILIKSSLSREEFRKHFRKFLVVRSRDGREQYFRFYDPRVLRNFLRTCDERQLREFFAKTMDYFVMEDEDPAYALRYLHENGILKTERFLVADIIAALPEPEPLSPTPEEPLPPETLAYMEEHGIVLPEMADESGSDKASQLTHEAEILTPPSALADSKKTNSSWNTFD